MRIKILLCYNYLLESVDVAISNDFDYQKKRTVPQDLARSLLNELFEDGAEIYRITAEGSEFHMTATDMEHVEHLWKQLDAPV